MKRTTTAAALALLAAAFLWQALGQKETPCLAARKAKREASEKEAPDDKLWKLACLTRYNQCVEACN